jgi:ABC-type nickel/cobalt efflux system permease component RcnA
MQPVASSMRATFSHSLEDESIIIILFVPITTFCSFVYKKVRNKEKNHSIQKKDDKKAEKNDSNKKKQQCCCCCCFS